MKTNKEINDYESDFRTNFMVMQAMCNEYESKKDNEKVSKEDFLYNLGEIESEMEKKLKAIQDIMNEH